MKPIAIALSAMIVLSTQVASAADPNPEQVRDYAQALVSWATRLLHEGDITAALAARHSADLLTKQVDANAATEPARAGEQGNEQSNSRRADPGVEFRLAHATILNENDADDNEEEEEEEEEASPRPPRDGQDMSSDAREVLERLEIAVDTLRKAARGRDREALANNLMIKERLIRRWAESRVNVFHKTGRHEDAEMIESVARRLFEGLEKPEGEHREREHRRPERDGDDKHGHHRRGHSQEKHDHDHPHHLADHHRYHDGDMRHGRHPHHDRRDNGHHGARKIEERLEHLSAAVEHLHAAGLHEPAEHIEHAARELREQRRKRMQAIHAHGGHHPGGPGLPRELEELRHEVRELHERLDRLEGERRRHGDPRDH